MSERVCSVWDYDIDEHVFHEILAGRAQVGRLDRRWAAVRLLEYAPYREIIRLIGYGDLVRNWPEWRRHVRSVSRRRGLDFIAEWIPRRHPELL
jgi:hypothetical protein